MMLVREERAGSGRAWERGKDVGFHSEKAGAEPLAAFMNRLQCQRGGA